MTEDQELLDMIIDPPTLYSSLKEWKEFHHSLESRKGAQPERYRKWAEECIKIKNQADREGLIVPKDIPPVPM